MWENIALVLSPGQEAGLLEDEAKMRRLRHAGAPADLPLEIGIEPGNQAEHRRLAGAGGADDDQDLPLGEAKCHRGEHRDGAAGEGFAADCDLEDHCRQRLMRRSQGCQTSHSIPWTTRMKASV